MDEMEEFDEEKSDNDQHASGNGTFRNRMQSEDSYKR